MTTAPLLMVAVVAGVGALGGVCVAWVWVRTVLPALSLHAGRPRSHAAEVIAELVETEASFVRQLALFLDVYAPAIRDYREGAVWRECGEFGAVAVLQQLHARLLADLRRARGSRRGIATAAIAMAPWLKLHVQFASAHAAMSKALAAERSRAPEFAALLQRVATVAHCDVDSLLIAPIQRLPRYCLLLAELLKQTPPRHGAYPLVQDALQRVREATKCLNECKRSLENDALLHELQESTIGLPEPLIAPQRRVLRVGPVRIVGGRGSGLAIVSTELVAQEATLLLTSDVLVVLSACPSVPGVAPLQRIRHVCRAFVRLSAVQSVTAVTGGSRGGRFEVHWQTGWMRFSTSCAEERQEWLNAFK